jgi:hypothetical protein
MKRKSMSRISTVVRSITITIACIVLVLGASAVAQVAGGKPGRKSCSNRTLFGDYGAQIEGTILGPNLTLRTLVMFHFDGEGTLTLVDHVVFNGVPPEQEWRPGSGTYTVNPDCTGSAAITADPPIPLHIVIVNRGKEFRGVVDGNAITITASRVD